ncbi:MAG: transglutaminase domain-containing protein [Chloroflexi bacterium]|nr:transglutaminase domain-containing protein [Chloroflexota bacterium]
MSTATTFPLPTSTETRPAGEPAFLRVLRRFTPREGWLTLALLLLSLMVVGWSVNTAQWVETPPLAGLILGSVAIGLVLAKVRLHGLWLHLIGLGVGAATIYWQTATLTEASEWGTRFQELNFRLSVWWGVVTSGELSTDLLPFSLMLAAVTWLVGYSSTWLIFRFHNFWAGVLPGALGIMTVLSYLPERYLGLLFLYLFFAALVAVRLYGLERQERWTRQGVKYPSSHGWFSLNDGIWFSVLVFLVAQLAPLHRAVSSPMRALWENARQPLDTVENEFNRLFSPVPSRKPIPYRVFGVHLPFQGAVYLSDDPVLYIDAELPTYWTVRGYAYYTSQGWLGLPTETHTLPWIPLIAQASDYRARIDLPQKVTAAFPLTTLPMATPPMSADRKLHLLVLPTEEFTLTLRGDTSSPSLPLDLRRSLDNLRRLPESAGAEEISQTLLQILPSSVIVTQLKLVETDSGKERRIAVQTQIEEEYPATLRKAIPKGKTYRLAEVRVLRKHPFPPDIVAVESRKEIAPKDSYSVVSWISVASEEELRRAGAAYPGWVLDHYLQLPASLPKRVKDLAQQLTASANNAYDKADALQSYLHTLTYDTQIQPLPRNADGVDHFLFTTRRAYSDYFASAMAVMARAVGIPARVAAGYAPGTFDPETKLYVVRDSDSHAWTEVFFPGYGWVAFEPTPGKGGIPRGLPGLFEEEGTVTEGGDPTQSAVEIPPAQPSPGDEQNAPPPSGLPVVGILARAGLALLLALVAVGSTLWYLFRRWFAHLTDPAAAYERMCRLASWARMRPRPDQTPSEYARALAVALPGLSEDVILLSSVYAKVRYGHKSVSGQEARETLAAWQRVRRRLVRRLLSRQ